MTEDTRENIRAAILKLLKTTEYKNIQMKEIAEAAHIGRRTLYRYFENKEAIINNIVEALMDDLTEIVNRNGRLDLEGIAYSYFVFWEKNLEVLRLLKKAHLMYLLEDNLPVLMIGVALKTKYKDKTAEEFKAIRDGATAEARYNYYYMLAGYVRVAQVWMEEENRRTPAEMAGILKGIVTRDFPGM